MERLQKPLETPARLLSSQKLECQGIPVVVKLFPLSIPGDLFLFEFCTKVAGRLLALSLSVAWASRWVALTLSLMSRNNASGAGPRTGSLAISSLSLSCLGASFAVDPRRETHSGVDSFVQA